jgi:hypothetical protein
MKVKCISNQKRWGGSVSTYPLVVGKVYNVISTGHVPFVSRRYDDYSGPFYKVTNEDGVEGNYSDDIMRPLNKSEMRDELLKELGI